MSGLLALWKQHTVTIRPYLGTDGYGRPQYGPPVAVTGWLDETIKTVRDPEGAETVSSTQFHCDLDTNAPALSEVALPGQATPRRVITASRRDGGAIAALPSHLELAIE